ncbi:UNVERIFIED_CONTAM: hypothetical protein FKN15_066937 [Acipenser sinensis]
MYWIVFAFFTTAETLTDIILSWFPFYFELKIAFVIWLLSPYTKGSSVLYRKFVHPTLSKKEKVKWMMYWIVFAFFTTAETLTDIILSWFPFYFELKIAFVIWLLSPYTKGSSVLYRKFVHPTLSKKEKEIDEYITQARDRSYETMMTFGKRGLNLAANAAVTAAAKGQGVLSDKLFSFSMQDLTLIHDEETVHLRSSDPPMHTSASSLLETMADSRGGGSAGQGKAQPEELHRSPKLDGDQSDTRTEQSDEDATDRAPKRTQSVKTVKKTTMKTEPNQRSYIAVRSWTGTNQTRGQSSLMRTLRTEPRNAHRA